MPSPASSSRSTHRPRSHTAVGWGWATAASAALVLVAILTGAMPVGWRMHGAMLAGLPLTLAVAGMALTIAAECGAVHGGQVRRAWQMLAVALLLVTMSDLATLAGGSVMVLPVAVEVSCGLVAYVLILAALRTFPTFSRSPLDRPVFWLDALIVLVGGALVLWQVGVHPDALPSGRPRWTLALAYPLADLLIFTAAVTAARRARRAATGTTLAIIAIAILLQAVSDLGGVVVTVPGSADWPVAAWLTARIVLVLAAHLELRSLAGAVRPHRFGGHVPGVGRALWRLGRGSLRPRALPFLGLLLGDGLLLLVAMESWPSELATLGVGAVVLTALVVARQLVVEKAARHTEHRFRSLVQYSSDVITVVDAGFRVTYASPAAMRAFGYSSRSMLGATLADYLHPDDLPRVRPLLLEVAGRKGTSTKVACRVRRADGDWCHTETVVTNHFDVESIGGLVLNTRDVSERTALEERLTHQAYHDPLTGLANRVLFRQRVDEALRRAGGGRTSVAVLFVDLDDFKRVNDSLGHAEGDRLLVTVAARLLNATRGCDTVARLGGDEFAILLQNVREVPDMAAVAERVLGAMQLPVPLDGREVLVGLSVGIARAAADDGPDDLLRNADVAMYISKKQGKGCYQLFRPEMHAAVVERLELEADMRKMLGGGAFGLRFQPIVALGSGRVTGVEALARWRHPARGDIPPATFVQLAEETGLIVPLGHWVLREACRHAASWQAEAVPGLPPVSITVNLSSRQLHEAGLVGEVVAALDETGVVPSSLVLEVTESVMMQDTEVTLARLRELKALGVQIAIDDFGTGYSSLAYLQRFPIDVMKIDRTFVDGVARSPSDLALVRAILSLADSLGLSTVAEGIEEEAQRTALLRLGCQLGQGYLFARPLASAEVGELLRRGTVGGWSAARNQGIRVAS